METGSAGNRYRIIHNALHIAQKGIFVQILIEMRYNFPCEQAYVYFFT